MYCIKGLIFVESEYFFQFTSILQYFLFAKWFFCDLLLRCILLKLAWQRKEYSDLKNSSLKPIYYCTAYSACIKSVCHSTVQYYLQLPSPKVSLCPPSHSIIHVGFLRKEERREREREKEAAERRKREVFKGGHMVWVQKICTVHSGLIGNDFICFVNPSINSINAHKQYPSSIRLQKGRNFNYQANTKQIYFIVASL